MSQPTWPEYSCRALSTDSHCSRWSGFENNIRRHIYVGQGKDHYLSNSMQFVQEKFPDFSASSLQEVASAIKGTLKPHGAVLPVGGPSAAANVSVLPTTGARFRSAPPAPAFSASPRIVPSVLPATMGPRQASSVPILRVPAASPDGSVRQRAVDPPSMRLNAVPAVVNAGYAQPAATARPGGKRPADAASSRLPGPPKRRSAGGSASAAPHYTTAGVLNLGDLRGSGAQALAQLSVGVVVQLR